jgi:hypothetical protein
VEVNKNLFYYLVRNYPVVKFETPNISYFKLGRGPYFLHENRKRIRNYIFNELETEIPNYFETEEQKKVVYSTLKQYINSVREFKNTI